MNAKIGIPGYCEPPCIIKVISLPNRGDDVNSNLTIGYDLYMIWSLVRRKHEGLQLTKNSISAFLLLGMIYI